MSRPLEGKKSVFVSQPDRSERRNLGLGSVLLLPWCMWHDRTLAAGKYVLVIQIQLELINDTEQPPPPTVGPEITCSLHLGEGRVGTESRELSVNRI